MKIRGTGLFKRAQYTAIIAPKQASGQAIRTDADPLTCVRKSKTDTVLLLSLLVSGYHFG